MCPGRCVVEDAKVRNSTEHNHAPEPDRVLVDKFRKVLTQRAANETTELYTIYWEEASQRHADAALLYTFTAAESAMRKARRKQLPHVSNTINELDEILANSSLFCITCGTRNDRFYQHTLNVTDATCAVFMHLPTLEAIGHVEELHINFSADAERTTPPVYHLMVVHAVQMQRVSEKCHFSISYATTIEFYKISCSLTAECTHSLRCYDGKDGLSLFGHFHLYSR